MSLFPQVSVVIPTHNRKKSAERLIRSILGSSYKNIEIIVIDDLSIDGTFEYLNSKFRSNKKIRIFRNKKNLFTAGTRNEGQKRAKGDFILFVDDDNVVDPKMIEEMVKVFKEDEGVGEVGPINFSFTKKNKVFWAGTYRNMFTTKTYHLTKIQKSDTWDTPDVPNAFMVKAQVIKKNKINLNPIYGIMYEESDYAYRIRKAGFKIVVARRAKIYHDTEEYKKGEKTKDYMFHFMSDPRRPYVFARNRILFHYLYSSKLQFIFIICFWIWFFSVYYVYRFISYRGYGDFTVGSRLNIALSYLSGTLSGLFFIFSKKTF